VGQPPQCAGSLCRSTHAAPHAVSPGVHPAALHSPVEHTCPAEHTLPQAPQFIGSTRRSTHASPHRTWPPSGQSALAPSDPTSPSASSRASPAPPSVLALELHASDKMAMDEAARCIEVNGIRIFILELDNEFVSLARLL